MDSLSEALERALSDSEELSIEAGAQARQITIEAEEEHKRNTDELPALAIDCACNVCTAKRGNGERRSAWA